MSLVRVKEKDRVTLPASVRRKAGVAGGDLLETKAQGRNTTLAPKIVIDRELIEKRLAEGLEDIRGGRVYGPFSSAEELVRSLRKSKRKKRKAS